MATATRDWLGDAAALGLARVIGTATAQLAEAVVDAFRIGFEAPRLATGTSYSDVVEQYVEVTRLGMPALEELVAATLRAHVVRASRGLWAPDEDLLASRRELFVGFADLVGYTALSRAASPAELARMVATFEETASDAGTVTPVWRAAPARSRSCSSSARSRVAWRSSATRASSGCRRRAGP